MSDVSIVFADGETLAFPAIADASVLVAAERAGNALAHNCRTGICRSCAGRAEDGRDVLLCQEPAREGFRATVPYRRADIAPASTRRAKINGFSRLSPSVWEIRYRLQFPLACLPGQYVEASFPGVSAAKRFSMASLPTAKEQILHVRDIQGGEMSAYLNNRAKPEDLFTLRGPFGTFYLRATGKPKLFVSGGTGLAPILAMLRAIERPPSPLAIIAGFITSEDAYALAEIKALAERLPLEIILTADKTDVAWPGLTGNPIAALRAVKTVPLAPGSEAYLCGPPGMVAAARHVLAERGLAPGDIYNEEFAHAGK